MRVRTTRVYLRWINGLKDRVARARIQVRVDRLVHGNLGRYRRVGGGVSELKMDFGPGYRVYFARRSGDYIVLLAGGDKSSQLEDIRKAIEMARELEDEIDG